MFESYGPIEKLAIVRNKETGKSRGYAFILYEREKDMKGTSLQPSPIPNCIDSELVFSIMQRPTKTPKGSRFSAVESSSTSNAAGPSKAGNRDD